MSRYIKMIAFAAICAAASAAESSIPKPMEPLSFLLGQWRTEGTGKPEEGAGEATFARGLQNRIITRTSFAEYPAVQGRLASRHDDLMIIYVDQSGKVRADYYDNEGHVIHYAVTATEDREATFSSDIIPNESRYRLTYTMRRDGILSGRFEIAPPGKPESFVHGRGTATSVPLLTTLSAAHPAASRGATPSNSSQPGRPTADGSPV